MFDRALPVAADCNLLFGILALQMDFISHDQLVGAMNAWALEKEKSLGQILEERRALAADERALLDQRVLNHLRRHGQDVQRNLAAARVAPPVRQALESISDPRVQASLVGLSRGAAEVDPNATRFEADTPPSPGLRFRVLRPRARGALGEI